MTDFAQQQTMRGYSFPARLFHWITAVLVLFQIPAGLISVNFELDTLYNLHKSTGVLILLVVVGRWLWRLTHEPPPLAADIPKLQQRATHFMHWTLYVLLIVQPLVGWIGTSAYPAPIPIYGLFEMPHIWWEDRALSERLFVVHLWIGIVMAVLLVGHIGAALYHYFVRKDQVLQRMLRGTG